MHSATLTAAILIGLASSAWAAAPNLLTYQGRLKESGSAVTGARQVNVYLCDALIAGTCTPSGEQAVAVSNGLFRTTFTVPAGVDLTTGNWYLEVRLGAGGTNTLAPREQLSASPYAVYASTAGTLSAAQGGATVSTNVFVLGKLGVGTGSPGAKLHVSSPNAGAGDTVLQVSSGTGVGQELLIVKGDGKVTVGPSPGHLVAGGVENLRIVRGNVNANGTIAVGTGFSVTKGAVGVYDVTFLPPFQAVPTMALSTFGDGANATNNISLGQLTPSISTFTAVITNPPSTLNIDRDWHFIAIGPR